MWFKNLQIYKIQISDKELLNLAVAISKNQFQPCAPSDASSQGFTSPRHNDQFMHMVNGQALLCMRFDKKNLPSKIIDEALATRCREIESQQGFAPGRKARKEIKEQVITELLPRAFAIQSTTHIWIDRINGFLIMDTSTPSRADEVIKALLKVQDIKLESLRVAIAPSAAMLSWWGDEEGPSKFSIDKDAKFVANTEDKSSVKFSNHPLDFQTTRASVVGKRCVEMAMTWDNRVSFVLTEQLVLKRIAPLDILQERASQSSANEDECFDADFVLMTAEIAVMLDDLIIGLGGEHTDTF